MPASNTETTKPLRISAEEARQRLESGRPVLVLDVRGAKAWDSSNVKIQGAIRMSPVEFAIDPSWPKDRFTLTYCT